MNERLRSTLRDPDTRIYWWLGVGPGSATAAFVLGAIAYLLPLQYGLYLMFILLPVSLIVAVIVVISLVVAVKGLFSNAVLVRRRVVRWWAVLLVVAAAELIGESGPYWLNWLTDAASVVAVPAAGFLGFRWLVLARKAAADRPLNSDPGGSFE